MYETFYNLSTKPFNLSPDPRFFFGSKGHKRAMSYLRYGLNQGEGFIIITGDIGTGKTTLVRTLFAELANENVVAAQLVTTQLEADDMLRMVAAAFGLAHDRISKATLLKNIETFLLARAREGKRVLLVVDEAQNLPSRSLEELRMLSNFQVGEKALLQSFLLGQEEFRNTLQADGLEQLRQRVTAAYHLSPLDRDETKAYIEHRLKMVGWKNDPQLTEDAYDGIHAFTDGVPRRVNTLLDRLLLYGYLEEAHQFNRSVVNVVTEELSAETSKGSVSEVKDNFDPQAKSRSRKKKAGTLSLNKGSKSTDDMDLEERIEELEAAMEGLKRAFRKERALMRQAILLNSGFDEDDDLI
ncbi:MAG: XrtA-associated ATPase [Gammaproteobacteria bacterium]|nr:XrtA-associated ATPase [Gammaproteobacteria bacterium]MDH5593191.1 XrtA-associated ATPase [Gammaproteobacteria bacterium]MDH5613531.1 XrtA-associated ATPase [Gammaproteobacteria bacterium]